ncbi:acylneuraminate cytidylyltransferase family protein [Chitinophaga ginsengisoli]|uniref:N-acylneuraminate cytidylyltransferase n=1 Tax=Chitinophaga ginsengisoli TaxID=363837 RepID=A0A2P8GPH3_9BACT|nr:acylneuraminate cytidylyltransferase family protein [Chitinophaga ginsengisoli]PSL35868.1 N-acylneuraminate cytidylyltransferase [Chitinophaga ginsengisoli]
MKTLFLIPARGGSKGVPGKNIKSLGGKPLINYAIDAVKPLTAIENICISTDAEDIKAVVEANGVSVPFLRPAYLAEDNSGTYEVCLHAIEFYEKQGRFFDVLVILQPTSPFRTTDNIREALQAFSPDLDMVVSVKETKANPYTVLFEEDSDGYLVKSKQGNFIRRQDCPRVWEYNGAIYVINIESLKRSPLNQFKKIRKYIMEEAESVDIDTPLDWEFSEFLISKKTFL